MGTRSLIGVIYKGEHRLAQYSQWDGYPDGQGAAVVEFIQKHTIDEIKNKFENVHCISIEEAWKELGIKDEKGFYSEAELNMLNSKYYFSRNFGADVLEGIFNDSREKIEVIDNLDFIKDSLFCEYAYIINLDENKLEFYNGFQEEPQEGNRYGTEKNEKGYYPCRLVVEYSLSEWIGEESVINSMNEVIKNEEE